MKTDKIDQALEKMQADVPVPSGLSARIMKAVEKKAVVLERRQIFVGSVQLALGVSAVIYGFTAIILNLLNGDLNGYLSVVSEDPSLLFTEEGLRALFEQVPILSALVFFAGLVYSIRHLMLRGVRIKKLSSVMAALFVVVAFGSFVGGMAVAANMSGSVTASASESLFTPLVTASNDYQYSSSGEVASVTDLDEETVEVTVLLPGGGQKIVEISKDSMAYKNVIQEGDKLFIVGKPGGFKKSGNMKANFVHLFSKD